jgi:type I restriction enzyme, S subunit
MVEDFKNTDAGIIPNDWNAPVLSEISDFENGKAHEQFIDDKGDYIVVNSKFISQDGRVAKYSKENLSPLSKGSIAIVMSDIPNGKALAKCFFIDKDNRYTLNQRIGSIIPFEEIDSDYLFYKLNRNKYFLSFDSGSGQTNLKKSEILACPVALPPTKDEQTAIATAIKNADALINQLEQLLTKKRNIKIGAMQELLKPKEGWVEKQLGEVVDINMGQSPDSKNYNSNQVGLPLLQGNADLENRKQLIRFWTSHTTKICDAGDLILTVRAPVGSIGVAIQKSCIGRGVCSLKPKSVSKDFIYHLLIFKEQDWKILEQGSTFTSANSNQIYGFEISIPKTEPEQTKIAKTLSDMDTEIQEMEKKLEKYKMLKQGMMQSLLTGKIRLV